MRAALETTGRLVFWRMAIKPGRPVAMGTVGSVPFIGLPGNPVAAFITFVHIARPLIAALGGAAVQAPVALRVEAAFSYRKKAGRRGVCAGTAVNRSGWRSSGAQAWRRGGGNFDLADRNQRVGGAARGCDGGGARRSGEIPAL